MPPSDDQTSYDQTALSPPSHPSTAVFSCDMCTGSVLSAFVNGTIPWNLIPLIVASHSAARSEDEKPVTFNWFALVRARSYKIIGEDPSMMCSHDTRRERLERDDTA